MSKLVHTEKIVTIGAAKVSVLWKTTMREIASRRNSFDLVHRLELQSLPDKCVEHIPVKARLATEFKDSKFVVQGSHI